MHQQHNKQLITRLDYYSYPQASVSSHSRLHLDISLDKILVKRMMQKLRVLVVFLLLLVSNVMGFFHQISRNDAGFLSTAQIQRKVTSRMYLKEEDNIPENETEEEMYIRLKSKARKMMFNSKGVPFAPWLMRQIDEDAIVKDLVRKEKGLKREKTNANLLDRGEIEASEGMSWRMKGNQVELGWTTSNESGNKGFIVEKRPSYGGDFREVASFYEVNQLQTQGPAGGRYRYIDPSTAKGSWIYRVKDCDVSGSQNTLCQCFVEVQTEEESKFQGALTIGFVLAAVAGILVTYNLDPPR